MLHEAAQGIDDRIKERAHEKFIKEVLNIIKDPEILKAYKNQTLSLHDLIEPFGHRNKGAYGVDYWEEYISLDDFRYKVRVAGDFMYQDCTIRSIGFKGNLYNYFGLPKYREYPSGAIHGGFYMGGVQDSHFLLTISSTNHEAIKHLYSLYKN